MKRITTILFAGLYLMASSGIVVGKHLCMGRVKETALFHQVEKKCGMSAEMHQDMEGCCEDELSLEKIDDSQQATVLDAPVPVFHLLYEIPFNNLFSTFNPQKAENNIYRVNDPPPLQKSELFIRYHRLKIPAL